MRFNQMKTEKLLTLAGAQIHSRRLTTPAGWATAQGNGPGSKLGYDSQLLL